MTSTPASMSRVTGGLLAAGLLAAGVLLLGPGTALWDTPLPGSAPAPPADLAAEPLRLPPDVTDPGGYTFLSVAPDGSPVAWDPCRPIHVAVRPDGEPAGGRVMVEAALREVGAATGLVIVVDGETDEAPATEDRSAVQPERYGDRWAPVLLAWSTEAEHPPLAGDTIGVAGPVTVDTGTGARYVSGQVVLEAPWFASRTGDGVAGRQARAVLLHELGHLMGLDHSGDPFALMAPQYQSVLDYGLADRAGLARLGRGPCFTDS